MKSKTTSNFKQPPHQLPHPPQTATSQSAPPNIHSHDFFHNPQPHNTGKGSLPITQPKFCLKPTQRKPRPTMASSSSSSSNSQPLWPPSQPSNNSGLEGMPPPQTPSQLLQPSGAPMSSARARLSYEGWLAGEEEEEQQQQQQRQLPHQPSMFGTNNGWLYDTGENIQRRQIGTGPSATRECNVCAFAGKQGAE